MNGIANEFDVCCGDDDDTTTSTATTKTAHYGFWDTGK